MAASVLVDDLLDISRITRGKIELRKELISIAEIVGRAVEIASPLLEQRSHRLTIDVPPDLVAHVDPARMVQVLTNLLTNATSYTEPGGDVRLIVQGSADTITIRVADTGKGISPALLPVMFDTFVQETQTLNRTRGGLGLGLAIVRSLVGLHGGTVSARSEGTGKGSEFSISLPRVRNEDAPSPATASPLASSSQGARVLLVDDNEDVALLMADALTQLGHEVRVACDGPSALHLAKQFTPTVALLDIGLPAMDGYELAARLRELPAFAGVSLIAIAGYGEPSAVQRCMDAGFAAHLVKPVDLTRLQEVVRAPAAK